MTSTEESANNKTEEEAGKRAPVPAIVESSRSGDEDFHITMDGTNTNIFNLMQNFEYSEQIIEKANKSFDLDKLKELKNKNQTEQFLSEGTKQILKLWQSIEALNTHNTMFVTLFLIGIGEILNEVKSHLKPHEFANWRRENFDFKHERYLQQAQQLAAIAEFAREHASLGKKRLLELDHLRKIQKAESMSDLLDKHIFPDTTEDCDGEEFKGYANGLVIYHRFKKVAIDFVTFDQARLMALFENDSISVKKVEKIKDWLDKYDELEEKKKQLKFLLLNKMSFPREHPASMHSPETINKSLADFVALCKEKIEDSDWIQAQKEKVHEDIFIKAYHFINILKDKFGISAEAREEN
jgi:hypothetical protein